MVQRARSQDQQCSTRACLTWRSRDDRTASRRSTLPQEYTCARVPGLNAVQAGEELVDVPTSALLIEQSVPKDFKEKHGDITLHGLLASFLAFGGDDIEPYALWRSTWPSMTDFEECMPMLWHEDLRTRYGVDDKGCRNSHSLLPPAIGNGCWAHPLVSKFSNQTSCGLLDEQEKKFQRDWDMIKRAFPTIARYTYLYYWLIINTRSFYFELPGPKATRPKDDRMALCPFADFFNHADHGVSEVEHTHVGAEAEH